MPTTPAPRRASRTSSSLNGLMMAVTRWGIPRSPLSVGRWVGGWLPLVPPSPSPGEPAECSSHRGVFPASGRAVSDVGRTSGQVGRRRVRHALAELDVVGGRSVLVDVEAFELA